MFKSNYHISDQLLTHIKRITKLTLTLNQERFPEVVLAEFEKKACQLSTFASTSIEGNPLPLTEVKKILKSQPKHLKDSEKEVLNYNRALTKLSQKLETDNLVLDQNLILEIQAQVIQGLLNKSQVGAWRKHPVVVRNPKTGQIIYLAPKVKDVALLMGELLAFVEQNQAQLDPVILAGIFHKQFVLIHPFMDGNGRTARLATKVLLAQLGLNIFNLFSFENYYNQNVSRYFKEVGENGDYYEFKDIDFSSWLEYFAEGIVDELLRVQKTLPNFAADPHTDLQAHHRQILKYIQKHQYITDKDYAQLVDRAKATRTNDFNKLLDLDLIERKGQGRATHYVLVER